MSIQWTVIQLQKETKALTESTYNMNLENVTLSERSQACKARTLGFHSQGPPRAGRAADIEQRSGCQGLREGMSGCSWDTGFPLGMMNVLEPERGGRLYKCTCELKATHLRTLK